MIEIELNESLRRRREELRGKIESLGEAEVGDASAAESLEARNRELKALNNSIEALNKKMHGKLPFCLTITLVFTVFQRRRRKQRN